MVRQQEGTEEAQLYRSVYLRNLGLVLVSGAVVVVVVAVTVVEEEEEEEEDTAS